MTKTLNILLGAVHAGLPLVNDIGEKFDRNLLYQFVNFSDSQWRWFETQNEVMQYNGRIQPSVIVLEFIYNRIISDFKKHHSVINYEKLYNFLYESSIDWFKSIFDNAEKDYLEYKKERGIRMKKDMILGHFESRDYTEVFKVFNYLISDLLQLRNFNNYEVFRPFISKLSEYDIVNIFTLNHDLLVEYILNQEGLKFSNGFTSKNSEIIGHDNLPQLTFQNEFSQNVRVIKLHGSIDNNGFVVTQQRDHINYRTGEVIYFKPRGYFDIHDAKRIDLLTNEVIQDFNFDITPQFLTGVLKNEIINSDYMYSKLYERYESEIASGNLLVIGYSFGDEHINSVIKNCNISGPIINVNPSVTFPFLKENVTNLKSIDNLISDERC